ncbi:MAG: NAD(P)-dependent dehydrogenase (short-subunit alcohol dehydrogenase family) [Arenicella sp.]|jgi:NAD(P)-dependent dehydrogenase (short-subunit alcohol dehydrogenase family)
MEKLEDFSEVGWDRVIDLNVKSPFFLPKELIPLLSAGASHESTSTSLILA